MKTKIIVCMIVILLLTIAVPIPGIAEETKYRTLDSGCIITVNNDDRDSYIIKGKTIDEHDVENNWATLAITIPGLYNKRMRPFMRSPLLLGQWWYTKSYGDFYAENGRVYGTAKFVFMVSGAFYIPIPVVFFNTDINIRINDDSDYILFHCCRYTSHWVTTFDILK